MLNMALNESLDDLLILVLQHQAVKRVVVPLDFPDVVDVEYDYRTVRERRSNKGVVVPRLPHFLILKQYPRT